MANNRALAPLYRRPGDDLLSYLLCNEGSPALDIAWVAAGRLDARTESLPPWDIAAANLIATEAGAMSASLFGGNSSLPLALRGENYLVAAPGVFEQLCELLRP